MPSSTCLVFWWCDVGRCIRRVARDVWPCVAAADALAEEVVGGASRQQPSHVHPQSHLINQCLEIRWGPADIVVRVDSIFALGQHARSTVSCILLWLWSSGTAHGTLRASQVSRYERGVMVVVGVLLMLQTLCTRTRTFMLRSPLFLPRRCP